MFGSVLSNAGKVAAFCIGTIIWMHAGEMQATGWADAWKWIAWTYTGSVAVFFTLDTWLEGNEIKRLSKLIRSKNRYIARLEREIDGYQRGEIIALDRERDMRRDDTEEGFSAG